MRLSSLFFAVVLLLAPSALAQHHESGSAPSAPPAAAPSPAPTPSFNSSAPPPSPPSVNSPTFHSAPEPASTQAIHGASEQARAPVMHSPPATSFTPSAGSIPSSTHSTSGVAPSPERIMPVEKISGEPRIAPQPRVGEIVPEKQPEHDPSNPDLRRRVCAGKDCAPREEKPGVLFSTAPHPICLKGNCTCPSGESWTSNGCATTNANTPPLCQAGTVWNAANCIPVDTCTPGESGNGQGCAPVAQCRAGELWDGSRCVNPAQQCVPYQAQATPLVTELQNLRMKIERICSRDSSSQDCSEAKFQRQSTLDRYRALWDQASSYCNGYLPDPGALM